MEFNFTAVTAKRLMAKAIARPSVIGFAKLVEEGCRALKHPDWDVLQIVINDSPEEFVKVNRISAGAVSRLIQVIVGFPELSLRPEDDSAFLDACARQIERAVLALKADPALKQGILSATAKALTRCKTK